MLCTTEAHKVPKTIKTRSTAFTLQPVADEGLHQLLRKVCTAENITMTEGITNLVVREAQGSPRQLLVNLELCRDVTDRKQAADLLRTALESDVTVQLCQLLIKGGSWQRAVGLVEQLDGQSPEGVRIIVNNYVGVVLGNTKDDKQALRLLEILDAFSHEYRSAEKKAPLLLSIGRVLLGS
jgi:DNA polymerase III gamma/tau subunit